MIRAQADSLNSFFVVVTNLSILFSMLSSDKILYDMLKTAHDHFSTVSPGGTIRVTCIRLRLHVYSNSWLKRSVDNVIMKMRCIFRARIQTINGNC